MKTFFSAILFLMIATQIVDAAPRRRGRSRRAAQKQYTRTTTSNRTVTNVQPQVYQPVQAPSFQTIQTQPVEQVVQASVAQPVQQLQATYTVASASPNAVPSVPETEVVVSPSPTPIAQASFQQPVLMASNTVTASGAIAEVNAIRARRGLPPFAEDASLSAVAYQKASIQANRGAMGHPGGSMGGARYEGVGMGNAFTSCYLYSNVGTTAGAASVRGANGQRYHCLLVR